MSKTNHKLKPRTVLMFVLYSRRLDWQKYKWRPTYISDIIPLTGEFKWFDIESFYALDSTNVNLSKIKKRLNWVQLAPFPASSNLQQIIKFLSLMITGNCTRIEKFSKCCRDVNKFLIVGLLRPENKKRFGRESEHLYWKIILPWDVKFQFCQISAYTKKVKRR